MLPYYKCKAIRNLIDIKFQQQKKKEEVKQLKQQEKKVAFIDLHFIQYYYIKCKFEANLIRKQLKKDESIWDDYLFSLFVKFD